MHVLLFLLWCALIELCFCVSWTCPTARICLIVLRCRASRMTLIYLTTYTSSIMFADWLVPMASNDRYCMLPSNDMSRNSKVDLSSPEVLPLDTTVIPDVFRLHAFDDRASLVRVLPGSFRNTVCVLFPDDRADPGGFHDVFMENLSNTPEYHVQLVSTQDLTLAVLPVVCNE